MGYKVHEHYKKGLTKARIGVKLLNKLPFNTIREYQNAEHAQRCNAMKVGKIINLTVPLLDWDLQVSVFRPDNDKVLPVVIYYHGGGFIFGQNNAILARQIASTNDNVCVFINYRLSPEYKFPTPLEDCYAATKYVFEHIDEIYGDKDRVFVCGDSAGGSLSMGVLQLNHERKDFSIKGQILMYPLVDYYADKKQNPHSSYKSCGKKYLLTTDFIKTSVEAYTRNADDYINPLIFSLKAQDLSFIPKTLIILSELDPLREEGLALSKKLNSYGVKSEAFVASGMLHAFMELTQLNEVKELYKKINDFIYEE